MSDTVIASSIIGGCGLIITFIYNQYNRKLSNDKMNKELFSELNARYDKFNDSLCQIVNDCKTVEDIEKRI
jgi:hypothetical protein